MLEHNNTCFWNETNYSGGVYSDLVRQELQILSHLNKLEHNNTCFGNETNYSRGVY